MNEVPAARAIAFTFSFRDEMPCVALEGPWTPRIFSGKPVVKKRSAGQLLQHVKFVEIPRPPQPSGANQVPVTADI